MDNIFERNNYRFGVESFLVMYLNKYQFVLGSDLENYAKSNETFTNGYPCNIYFILRRPKVTIDPDSVKINGNKADFDLIIHHHINGGIAPMSIILEKAKSEINFHTQYPYNLFTFSDKNGVLFGARPGTLIDSSLIQNNFDLQILDYEILYIGQAYGNDGKRTAIDRLSSHETLQKIYTHSLSQNPDSDIWVMLTNFSQESFLMSAGSDLTKVNEKDTKIEDAKVEHFFSNKGFLISEKQKINFTEAALIRYYQPKYNIEFKDSFPSSKHKSYSECYSLDIKALTVEIDTSENSRKIYTEKSGRKEHHIKMFEFNSDADRVSLMEIFK